MVQLNPSYQDFGMAVRRTKRIISSIWSWHRSQQLIPTHCPTTLVTGFIRGDSWLDIQKVHLGLWHSNIMLKEVLFGLLAGAAFFTVGILLGHFAIDKGGSVPEWVRDASRDVDESIIEKFLAELDTNEIKENLRWSIYSEAHEYKILNDQLCRTSISMELFGSADLRIYFCLLYPKGADQGSPHGHHPWRWSNRTVYAEEMAGPQNRLGQCMERELQGVSVIPWQNKPQQSLCW